MLSIYLKISLLFWCANGLQVVIIAEILKRVVSKLKGRPLLNASFTHIPFLYAKAKEDINLKKYFWLYIYLAFLILIQLLVFALLPWISKL